jgi:hypothetical protein
MLTIEGVDISVAPSLILRGGGVEEPRVGAVKLYLVKTNPLDKRSGEYAATILRVFLESRLEGSPLAVDRELCQVADVFASRVFAAPRAYKRRMEDVAVACDSIRRLWASYLDEGGDYTEPTSPSATV